uniref:Uncharacterized protein n=1 Tax=Neisseria meningitidis alpha275 TaxID=295996 RepID=C6SN75_NEIME|nr:hypothetical protein predicted by Glimmer/Critica [Neisseria meningitidis alpha275]
MEESAMPSSIDILQRKHKQPTLWLALEIERCEIS